MPIFDMILSRPASIALRKFRIDHAVPEIDRALLDRAAALLDPANPASVNLPGGRRLRRREGRLWVD